VIARHGLRTKKSLGQHFLCDLNLTRIIAESAGDLSGHTVFEIGPGPGGLTRALVESDAAHVVGIEKDARCLAALAEIAKLSHNKLEVVPGDALEIDLTKLGKNPRAVVANLPYNIGTELLVRWLQQMPAFTGLTLMFQTEVADRIAAEPGSKAYGRLSVIAQHCCLVESMLDIPPEAFTPPPKVNSTVIHLVPRPDRPQDVQLKVLERVTAAAFGQRRKMLRQSLKVIGGEALLAKASIDPTLRAENLSLGDFESLTRCLQG